MLIGRGPAFAASLGVTAPPGRGPLHWTSRKRVGGCVGKVFGLGSPVGGRRRGRQIGRFADAPLPHVSQPFRRERSSSTIAGGGTPGIANLKWVRWPEAAAGPPINTPRNYTKQKARRLRATAASQAGRSRQPLILRPCRCPGPPENGPEIRETLERQEPSEANEFPKGFSALPQGPGRKSDDQEIARKLQLCCRNGPPNRSESFRGVPQGTDGRQPSHQPAGYSLPTHPPPPPPRRPPSHPIARDGKLRNTSPF